MAVKIRLARLGDKKSPFYRMVVADSRCARNGKFIENLGTYDPLKNPAELKLNKERVQYWLGVGATPTDTARELLVKDGILAQKPYVAPRPKKMPPAPKAKAENADASTENAEGEASAETSTEASA